MSHQLRIIETTIQPPTEQEEIDGDWYDEGEVTDDYLTDVEPDEGDIEEGITAVDLAEKFLSEHGASEPNCSRGTPDWFNTPDEDVDMYTGESTVTSIHLIGFTEQEASELGDRVRAW